MSSSIKKSVRLDAIGLFLAGLINTFLSPIAAVIVFGPGTEARQPDLLLRVDWIAENSLRWQVGWLFWFAVTLSFAWSYFALGRHLDDKHPWRELAIGLALIAAAVDLVGVIVNLTILPEIAKGLVNLDPTLLLIFQSLENFSFALINISAFGLYSFAGLLLLPAIFATQNYPRWLAWLGTVEWTIAALATFLLVAAPDLVTGPLLISFALYAPWVWFSGLWLLRNKPEN